MHRCLLILEVLSEICSHLSLQGEDSSLVSFARTCQALHGPALNQLWSCLTDFTPLVKCLPEDVWRETAHGSKKVLSIKRSLRVADWERFRVYSTRVHHLCHSQNNLPSITQVPSSVFVALSSPTLAGPLFPNLRCLHWDDGSEDAFRFLNVAIGEKIHHVDIVLPHPIKARQLYESNTPANRFLPTLVHCAGIKCLDIKFTSSVPEVIQRAYCDAVSDVVLQMNHLVSLTCGYLTHDALVHLGSLASLRSLSFTLSPGQPLADLTMLRDGLFQNLDTITVQSFSNLEESSAFLNVLAKRPKELLFTAPKIGHSELVGLIGKLTAGGEADNPNEAADIPECTTLVFAADDAQDEEDELIPPHFYEDSFLKLSDLIPLFKFRSLQNLAIEGSMPVSLTDSEVADLASAWPNIITLNIGGK
ncbi:hypothetical protein CONPUDRAFT_156131 [Coniophora puteana RWD-64-598 SS2]|uniref:F-box domain-containing protein n=1 Tax=Coniophora puteana (strain RWD-64-598) TaxID=741705 RepID=A0A5M3MHL6_CONPW|nr:uncharacterized protein CONPUDRAFT_156131 [Coniophora puteana RWD-64-598 SS2]EIW78121.1 hypothetical protein CONPUDRAFT_156131 [Coniophora puteana RWD-64-598 SS2]